MHFQFKGRKLKKSLVYSRKKVDFKSFSFLFEVRGCDRSVNVKLLNANASITILPSLPPWQAMPPTSNTASTKRSGGHGGVSSLLDWKLSVHEFWQKHVLPSSLKIRTEMIVNLLILFVLLIYLSHCFASLALGASTNANRLDLHRWKQ